MNHKAKKSLNLTKCIPDRDSSTEEELPAARIDSEEDDLLNPKFKRSTSDQKITTNYWKKLDIDLESSRKFLFKPQSITLPKNWNSKNPTTLDFFSLILDDDFFQKVVTRTNEYAKDTIEANEKDSKVNKNQKSAWKDLSIDEFRIFLGLFFWMGLVRLPDMKDHWSTSHIFQNSSFTKHMSRDRFLEILRNLRFDDPKQKNNDPPYNKIFLLIHTVMSNSMFRYSPSSNLSLDESMISFKGRHKSKVYMPHKPIRIGFKAYVLCDSETGFLLGWKMHAKQEDPDTTKRIVLDLLSIYTRKNVYMDRYYSTTEIFEDLETFQDIYACGTINPIRCKLTPEMKEEIKNLKNERALFYTHGELQLCIWKTHKGKVVSIASTIHDNAMAKTQRFCTILKKKIETTRPEVLEDYNNHMRGVDFFDQQMRYYSFLHGSKKWYKKIAFYFLEVAVLNSYVIYEIATIRGPILDRKKYTMDLIDSLLRFGSTIHIEPQTLTQMDCYLAKNETILNCTVCSTQDSRKRSAFKCGPCNATVCAIDCYDRHRNERYSHK
jgi:hypothetical protein